ncbi:hypothetical protein B9Z55_007840 [Caenorhabditis nigoni]|uniref:BTB domain-containing protein n=2 Tax=Caenorhabditis nigoni TaxID=1611254 RepID=A0A2G5VBG3_9PELO|nr:hypothetical protein B9Z55_007840 [Caenorhabditis nigoni]
MDSFRSSNKMTDIVKLNVGGTMFQTSKSTLTKFDGFFKTLLETGIPVTKDNSSAIFIDRSPKHFEKILDFLRDGDVALPESLEDVSEIQKEAQFYLLDGLVKLCIWKPKVRKSSFFIDSDEEVARFIAESKKKAVLVVFYKLTSNSLYISELVVETVMRCGDKIDVCFKSFNESQFDHFFFHDKIKNKISKGNNILNISGIAEDFIRNIDKS